MRTSRTFLAFLFVAAACAAATACGAGPYGFAKTYVPVDGEDDYWDGAEEFTYESVNSNPDDYQGKLIGWFGVVESVTQKEDGGQEVRMSHRKHQPRHLCDSDSPSSCRVTVHFKSSGSFSARVALTPDDMKPGLDKVQPGSLLRVYGKVRCRENDDEQIECDYDDLGGILLDTIFYRQWPARFFVTTRAAESMRR